MIMFLSRFDTLERCLRGVASVLVNFVLGCSLKALSDGGSSSRKEKIWSINSLGKSARGKTEDSLSPTADMLAACNGLLVSVYVHLVNTPVRNPGTFGCGVGEQTGRSSEPYRQ